MNVPAVAMISLLSRETRRGSLPLPKKFISGGWTGAFIARSRNAFADRARPDRLVGNGREPGREASVSSGRHCHVSNVFLPPFPNTSWMDDPWPRERFAGGLPMNESTDPEIDKFFFGAAPARRLPFQLLPVALLSSQACRARCRFTYLAVMKPFRWCIV